jgi:beta-glucanase (GH16 family)
MFYIQVIVHTQSKTGTRLNAKGSPHFELRKRCVSKTEVFETEQALMSRFGKLWTEDYVQWRTDARAVRIIWGLLSRRQRNKPVVYHAVNQLL